MNACSPDMGFALIVVAFGVSFAVVHIAHGLKAYFIAKGRAIEHRIDEKPARAA